jgi:ribonuclease-3
LAETLRSEDQLFELVKRINYSFSDDSLLSLAMSHRSWCAEQNNPPSNERLELLGDAVLGHCITDHLFRSHPEWTEGELAQARSAVVNAASLAGAAKRYQLGHALLLGIGEERSGGREKASLLGDAFEALLGAMYLDGGLEIAQSFILEALQDRIDEVSVNPGIGDAKTRLQEFVVRVYNDPPNYALSESGPDHDKRFHATVAFGGSIRGEGHGSSKKQAEQAAAEAAWTKVQRAEEIDKTTNQGKSKHVGTA